MKTEARPTVGVRELKQSLSSYLRRVRHGESIVVTDRGKPIARISPVSLPESILRLAELGKVTLPTRWPPEVRMPTLRLGGTKTAAEDIIEARQSWEDAIDRAAFPSKGRKRR